MLQTWENELTDLGALELDARSAEVVTWHGHRALKLDGLAILPYPEVLDATIEVEIGAEGPCYAGIAFGVCDVLNYELAYAVPHCSGIWDAVQYDPVFHGSNTWQLYHGPAYQQPALVPTGEWFHLKISRHGGRAAIQVDEQPPLWVKPLAHVYASGRVGVWTFKPAFFRALRVTPAARLTGPASEAHPRASGALSEWFLDGYGRVLCEPNGTLNLNRYLPMTVGEAHLTRAFELAAAAEVELDFGFSDELSLAVDGQRCFSGANTFKGFGGYQERGYSAPGAHRVCVPLEPGLHWLEAKLKVSEYFGWGMILRAAAPGLGWLSATNNSCQRKR